MRERWKAIPGYDGWYEVSDRGRIRSYRKGGNGGMGKFRRAKPTIRKPGTVKKTGAQQITLFHKSKRKLFFVHRLVLLTFVGSCPPGLIACHRDDDQTNNRLKNLRWDTHKGNMADRARNGNTARGSRVGTAILDEVKVEEMLNLRKDGVSLGQIAIRYGVDKSTVWKIDQGLSWKHVKRPR